MREAGCLALADEVHVGLAVWAAEQVAHDGVVGRLLGFRGEPILALVEGGAGVGALRGVHRVLERHHGNASKGSFMAYIIAHFSLFVKGWTKKTIFAII